MVASLESARCLLLFCISFYQPHGAERTASIKAIVSGWTTSVKLHVGTKEGRAAITRVDSRSDELKRE